ncbi:C47 family peptidase, partial [Staphylococcus aureus]
YNTKNSHAEDVMRVLHLKLEGEQFSSTALMPREMIYYGQLQQRIPQLLTRLTTNKENMNLT